MIKGMKKRHRMALCVALSLSAGSGILFQGAVAHAGAAASPAMPPPVPSVMSGTVQEGTALEVKDKDIHAKSIAKFDTYNFKLNETFEAGDTMLTVADAGAFGGAGVDWSRITVDRSGLSSDYFAGIHGICRVVVLKSKAPMALHFTNYAIRIFDATDTHESALMTDTDKDTASSIEWVVNRFRGSHVIYDGSRSTEREWGEAFGGISYDGHTTMDNVLTVTGVNGVDDPMYATGGKNEGVLGDVIENKAIIDLKNTKDVVKEIYGGLATNEHNTGIVRGNTVVMKNGTTERIYGGYTYGTGAVTHNTVQFAGGTSTIFVMGGFTTGTGGVANNTVYVHDGISHGHILGGYIDNLKSTAEMTGNRVIVTGGTTEEIDGAYSKGKGVLRGNRIIFGGVGTTAENLYGGRAQHEAGVVENSVMMTNGVVCGEIMGGCGARADSNEVVLTGGTAHEVYGGDAVTGDAVRNNVTITGGTVTGNICGGHSLGGAANDNTIDIGAVHIQNGAANKAVVGGYASAVTDHNTIRLRGTELDGIVLGGAIADSKAPLGMRANPDGKDNTLAIHAEGTKITDFAGVQRLHFYVPETYTAEDRTPMLTLTANADKDIRGLSVGVGIAGDHSPLTKGDAVRLLKVADGKTLAADTVMKNDITGVQGVSMRYRLHLEKRGDNELVAVVGARSLNPQTKSLVETRAASAALLGGGADLLADSGMSAAAGAAGAGARDGAFALWAAQGGSALRLNSGSHVDAKGWSINLGFARKKALAHSTLTYGPLVEYGRSSYDSYLDDGTHGDGAASYIGAGIMAKSQHESGPYVEGSLRVGRTKSDYRGNIAGTNAGYDMSSTYYAAHVGIGQEKKAAGGTLDTYVKYFYTYQSGASVHLSTGAVYDFAAVNSHRLRVGARWTKESRTGAFYTGLAYEYEFDSDARASYAGESTPTPTLRGSTGLFEPGCRFARPDSSVSYGLNLTGMMGKRRGITGGVQVQWTL